MGDKNRGIYEKFEVRRTDGQSEPGGKHENCQYFVLDLDCDKFAPFAILQYAAACSEEYPELSKDLKRIAGEIISPESAKRWEEYNANRSENGES